MAVRPGDTEIAVSQARAFPLFGELRIGTQRIHFSGRTEEKLLGIPASGPGSVSGVIPLGTPVRCLNAENTSGNLRISAADVPAGFAARFRTLAERWVYQAGGYRREPAGWTLPGSPLLGSFAELAGEASTLVHYDFSDGPPPAVADLAHGNHPGVIAGTVLKVPAAGTGYFGMCAHFVEGHIEIPERG